MSLVDVATCFVTLFVIAVAPGPVMLVLFAKSSNRDIAGASAFGMGFALGGVLFFLAIGFGFHAWLSETPAFLTYSRYLVMTCILWMAWNIWHSSATTQDWDADKGQSAVSSLFSGLTMNFLSPAAFAFFPAILSEMSAETDPQTPVFLTVAVLSFLARASGAALIVLCASRLRWLVQHGTAMLIINRSLASVLVLGSAWVAIA